MTEPSARAVSTQRGDALIAAGEHSPHCVGPTSMFFYCLLLAVSNATFHFKPGASGDDSGVSQGLELSAA